MVPKSAGYGLVFYRAVFSAFVAIILAALWSVILFALPSGAIHSVAEAAKTFLVMCGFTAIPAGGFGFVAQGQWEEPGFSIEQADFGRLNNWP